MLNLRSLAIVTALCGASFGGVGLAEPIPQSEAKLTTANFAPVTASHAIGRLGGVSGAELKLSSPQSHSIQFLKGGAARVAIWDGYRYLPRVFTSVESQNGNQVCLARTRNWTGGCLTITSNGQNLRCRYLWNNGARGETACRITPLQPG